MRLKNNYGQYFITLLLGMFLSLAQSSAEMDTAVIKQHKEIFDHLKQMTEQYSNDKGFFAKFKRIQVLGLLGEEDTTKGELFYSEHKLRLDLKGQDASMVLITPEVIWNVNYENGKIKTVMKGKPTPHPLLQLLFGEQKNWDKFEIRTIHINTEGQMDVTLVPKASEQVANLTKVRFKLNKKKNTVVKLTYWDELENETTMSFTYTKFKDKIDASKFKFTPPSDVKVTNI